MVGKRATGISKQKCVISLQLSVSTISIATLVFAHKNPFQALSVHLCELLFNKEQGWGLLSLPLTFLCQKHLFPPPPSLLLPPFPFSRSRLTLQFFALWRSAPTCDAPHADSPFNCTLHTWRLSSFLLLRCPRRPLPCRRRATQKYDAAHISLAIIVEVTGCHKTLFRCKQKATAGVGDEARLIVV